MFDRRRARWTNRKIYGKCTRRSLSFASEVIPSSGTFSNDFGHYVFVRFVCRQSKRTFQTQRTALDARFSMADGSKVDGPMSDRPIIEWIVVVRSSTFRLIVDCYGIEVDYLLRLFVFTRQKMRTEVLKCLGFPQTSRFSLFPVPNLLRKSRLEHK